MSRQLSPKVLVIGGGPGGYVAAIRAGQLGLDTVLVDSGRLGGTCLVRGCIPSKALIHVAELFSEMREAASKQGHFGIHAAPPELRFPETIAWKDGVVDRLSGGIAGLLRKAKVNVIHGHARFLDARTCRVQNGEEDVLIRAEHVVLATGSLPMEIPTLPFGGKVMSSTEALSLDRLPERLAIVGAGYIGLELGSAFAKLGSKVTVIEAGDRILPQYDDKLTAPVARWLAENGIELHLSSKALGLEKDELAIEDAAGKKRIVPADKVLVTVGRRPATQGWGLEEMALRMNGAFVSVDESCATSTKNVWAIGDLVGEPMLAHKASAQGEMVAEIIAGKRRRFDPVAIPAVCFTEPEIVTVGLSPEEAAATQEVITGQFPFLANGRALSMGAGDKGGFVRVVARKDGHRILGIQGVGRNISEFAGQFATLLEMGAVLEDVAGIIHAHPTLGEAIHESALNALGHAIHI